MQTIETTYLRPTNYRGSRVVARSASGKAVVLAWDDRINSEDNHTAAAKALCKKLDWHGDVCGGHTKRGMVWVFASSAFYHFIA